VSDRDSVRVIPYEARHHDAFRALNVAWITEYFEMEEPDRWQLDQPDTHIIALGGHIFIAESSAGEVAGTSALLRGADGGYWLAKMAVAPHARGRGIGRLLAVAAIEKARSLGVRQVALLSNTVLEPAIQLYRSLGFIEAPLPSDTGHVRANIHMVLDLTAN
jgi:GNAT superfamily N-acetyltransferase